MALSWKPVLRGAEYCAPACGRHCTKKEYDLAKARAKALVKRLGRTWEARIWENLGWHYCVHTRFIAVYPHIGPKNVVMSYWATTLTTKIHQHYATGKTPEEALSLVKKKLQRSHKNMTKALKELARIK